MIQVVHQYLSTACLHGLHDRCRKQCKFCTAECICACHRSEVVTEETKDYRAAKDEAYLQRNHLVAALAHIFPSGIGRTAIEGWHSEWHGCAYIDLPTGQISYHYHDSHAHLFADLPAYTKEWDGHGKDEVHARLAALGHTKKIRDELMEHCTLEEAAQWLRTPQEAFDGKVPMALIVAGRHEEVRRLIEQIWDGDCP